MELRVIHWDQEDLPTEEQLTTQLVEQELKVYRWAKLPKEYLAGHTHGYHKILCVIDGSIKFEFPTRHKTLNLNAGDRLELPAGIRHNATVGMDGVKCLEAHIY